MKASATIMGSLSIKVQAQIPGDSPTPKEIWDRLLKLYDQIRSEIHRLSESSRVDGEASR
ncbi:hypothetical protein LIPSTDRAFT_226436 [Lipomyces starkeyi NRRL Y-11557]|uniref:Uncharacterized protein n=1 Tax=Lipomyces starkeyi NRRL Y-11557 TaxID=675824 RepID=A0A1E3PTP7_LIPST|nr:hypothetical protein LIPSTDRAFT_226436 [Lipomyces starkeyi NRRL Y-11557]